MFSREVGKPNGNRVWLGVVLASSLAISACNSGGIEAAPSGAENGSVSVSAAGLGSSVVGEAVMLVFDDLGGGASSIQVYPGAQDTPQDKQYNGTYPAGEAVEALCVTTGREVSSNPAVGEEPRTSDEWIRIVGTPGEVQYATAVYIQNPEHVVSKLPSC